MHKLSLFFRRRQYIVHPPLQRQLVMSALSFGLICMIAVIAAMVLPLIDTLSTVDADSLEAGAAADQLLYLVGAFALVVPFCLLAIALGALRISHRIAGPIVRFSTALEAVKNGQFPRPVTLRQTDLLHAEAQLVNDVVENMRNSAANRVHLVNELLVSALDSAHDEAHEAPLEVVLA